MARKNKIVVFALLLVLSLGLITSLVFLVDNKSDNKQQEVSKNNVEAVTSVDELDASVKGGAIYLEPNAEFTMSGGVIEGHESTYGGAVYVSNGATFTMEGGIIESGSATNGGAIYVAKGGTCIINGGTITECVASENGGAIYVEDGGSLTIQGEVITEGTEGTPEYTVNFSKNTAELSGGAIYMQDSTEDSILTLKNVTFSENQGKMQGGAVRVKGYITVDGSNVAMINNKIVFGASDPNRGLGAGLYAEAMSTNLSDGARLSINFNDYSYFVGNEIDTDSSLQAGGAISVFMGGYLYVERGILSENKIIRDSVNGDRVYGRGAAIYVYHYVDVVLGEENAEADSLVFDDNHSTDTSGALGLYFFSNATINSAKMINNYAKANGGAIYATESTLALNENVLIENNYSTRGGGVTVFKRSSVLDINGSTITNNKLKNTVADGTTYGANLFSNGAIVNFNSGTISGGDYYDSDSVIYGGGIGVVSTTDNQGVLNIYNGSISNCKGLNGGAIFASGAEINIHKLSISNCIASNRGAGIFILDHASYNTKITKMENISIQNCNALSHGGAISYESVSDLTMTVDKIEGNTSNGKGGALYILNPIKLNIVGANNSEGSISSNTAGIHGGAISMITETSLVSDNVNYNYNKIDGTLSQDVNEGQGAALHLLSGGSILINRGQIIGNTIKDCTESDIQFGAAVFLAMSASFSIKTGEISDNIIYQSGSANGRGGAIFCYNKSTVNIGVEGANASSVLINRNSSVETSGALGIYSESTLNIYSGTISENVSKIGGAIYSTASEINLYNNVVISENKASNRGGGICLFNNSTLNIDGATITKNKVLYYGGGIEAQRSVINFNSGLISENGAYNNATIYGGGIGLRVGASLIMNGGTISDNSAFNGAGIMMDGYTSGGVSTSVIINNGSIDGNSAVNFGGAIYISNADTFDFKNGSILDCTANKGAAVYVVSGGTYVKTGGTISGCISTTGNDVFYES